MKIILTWIGAAFVFCGLDALWLGFVAPNFYAPLIGELLSNTIEPVPAIAFYLIYITALVVLAVDVKTPDARLARAAFKGAVLGLAAYGCYDLTNQATLKVWDLRITLADLAWGALISAAAAAAALSVARRTARAKP